MISGHEAERSRRDALDVINTLRTTPRPQRECHFPQVTTLPANAQYL